MALTPKGWKAADTVSRRLIDWLGVNYYTRRLYVDALLGAPGLGDARASKARCRKTAMDWEIYPEARLFLAALRPNRPPGLPIYITENGVWPGTTT
ncbi:MAG: family 1 glycosylhydrolase [Defluviimonas denitrificans]